MEEKNIKRFFFMMKKRSWLIIALTIIPMIISSTIILFADKAEPEYKASTSLIIGGPKDYLDSEKQLDYDTYKSINGKLIANFNELIQMEVVIGEVINNLGLDMSYKEFNEKMEVELIDKTEIMKIEVINKDADVAEKIINEVVKVSSKTANEIMGIENVGTIDKIQIVEMPIKSKATIRIFAVGVLGFMVSIFIIVLLEYTDRTIKFPIDIEKHLKLPVLSILKETEENLAIYEKPDSFVAENYRNLMTNIQSIKMDKKIKSILITSATFKEERSVVSINMAATMAQVDGKVLLVDGDLRNPNIHRFFDVKNNQGLSNVLNGEIEYKEAIKNIEIKENFHLLTSGPITSNPGGLLSSDNMKNLIEKLKKEYDTIILNAPSLGVMTDSVALSGIVDGTILVCEAGKSEIEDMKTGKELLDKVNSNILGVILNKVCVEKNGYYKYYYDSYSFYEKEKAHKE